MSFIKKIEAATQKEKLQETVNSILNEAAFTRSLPDMISAARSGILVGHTRQKPEMVKFNSLCLTFLEAIHKKDLAAATIAADALVKAGHGAVVGF